MALEIERKYLIKNTSYRNMSCGSVEIVQGYICRNPERVVRVRKFGEEAFITLKGKNKGLARLELEYPVPLADFDSLLSLCRPPVIRKTRYFVDYEGKRWEVDEYHGQLEPLVTAEVELVSADEKVILPAFVGREVSGDPMYCNSNLGLGDPECSCQGTD